MGRTSLSPSDVGSSQLCGAARKEGGRQEKKYNMDNINIHLHKPHRKYMGDIQHRYLSLRIREYVGKRTGAETKAVPLSIGVHP